MTDDDQDVVRRLMEYGDRVLYISNRGFAAPFTDEQAMTADQRLDQMVDAVRLGETDHAKLTAMLLGPDLQREVEEINRWLT